MKKIIIALVIFLVVCLILAGGWWLKNKSKTTSLLGISEALAKEGIILEAVKGQVKISFEGEEKTLDAPSSREVEPGVVIATLTGGQANIIFPNGSLARLDEDTAINLTEFIDEAQSSGIKLQLNSGNLWSRVQRLLDKETSYEVQTANTVAVVKGTVFNASFKEGKTKVEVLDKKVAVKAIDPKTKQVLAGGETEVESGNFVELDEKEPPTAQKPLLAKILSAEQLGRAWLKDNLAKDKKIEEKILQANGGSLEIKQQDLKEKVLSAVVSLEKKDFSDKPLFEKFKELKAQRDQKIKENKKEEASPSPSARLEASPSPKINKITPTVSAPAKATDLGAKISITGIDPDVAYGPGYQYTKVVIKGSGFGPLTKGSIGNLALTGIKILNDNTLEAMVSQKIQPGTYDVILTNGPQRAVLPKGFEVLEAE